jgi:hypothetical protein
VSAWRARLTRPHLWIALCSGALVMCIALVGAERKSPGPLTAVHGSLEALRGGTGCADCHGGWFSNLTDSCLECHEPIDHQLEQGQGLHGRLGEQAERCALCHSEHHGEGFAIVGRQSFARAGVPEVEQFDHRLVGFAMEGRHLELSCAECHANADVAVLPEGQFRYLGLRQDCASCHDDPHDGGLRLDCRECHVQQGFELHRSLGHERHLPLTGGHDGLDCRQCHGADGPHALEEVVGEQRGPPARECLDCHASPHGTTFAAAEAERLGQTLGAGCVGCHGAEHLDFAQALRSLSPAQHAASGFALELPHADLECAACHDAQLGTFAARHPGRGPEQCVACHSDPHGGQFDPGPGTGPSCTECHARTHFAPHEFSVERHARTALPLTGRHLETDCQACHLVPAEGEPRRFAGTAARCDQCHDDAHGGFFAPVLSTLEAVTHGDCARCHDPEGFAARDPRLFDHGRFTGFALAGAHGEERCETCHPAVHGDGAPERRLGRAADHFGELGGPFLEGHGADRACALCHADPHRGGFDGEPLPRVYAGREGCARCHGEVSFRSFERPFDHGLWTGFPLEGAHAEPACSACHGPLRPVDERGRSWRPAPGADCAACHQDPHAGQFEVQGATDCARCHRPTTDFRDLHFDHNWDSRFPLDETHRAVACDQCHRPAPSASGEVVRYRPLGRECTDCHGVQSGALRRRGGSR